MGKLLALHMKRKVPSVRFHPSLIQLLASEGKKSEMFQSPTDGHSLEAAQNLALLRHLARNLLHRARIVQDGIIIQRPWAGWDPDFLGHLS